jgi:hypothetical protein
MFGSLSFGSNDFMDPLNNLNVLNNVNNNNNPNTNLVLPNFTLPPIFPNLRTDIAQIFANAPQEDAQNSYVSEGAFRRYNNYLINIFFAKKPNDTWDEKTKEEYKRQLPNFPFTIQTRRIHFTYPESSLTPERKCIECGHLLFFPVVRKSDQSVICKYCTKTYKEETQIIPLLHNYYTTLEVQCDICGEKNLKLGNQCIELVKHILYDCTYRCQGYNCNDVVALNNIATHMEQCNAPIHCPFHAFLIEKGIVNSCPVHCFFSGNRSKLSEHLKTSHCQGYLLLCNFLYPHLIKQNYIAESKTELIQKQKELTEELSTPKLSQESQAKEQEEEEDIIEVIEQPPFKQSKRKRTATAEANNHNNKQTPRSTRRREEAQEDTIDSLISAATENNLNRHNNNHTSNNEVITLGYEGPTEDYEIRLMKKQGIYFVRWSDVCAPVIKDPKKKHQELHFYIGDSRIADFPMPAKGRPGGGQVGKNVNAAGIEEWLAGAWQTGEWKDHPYKTWMLRYLLPRMKQND